MGQADILGNLGDGLYTILVKRNRALLDAQLARIADALAKFGDQKTELQPEIDELQSALDAILTELDALIDAYDPEAEDHEQSLDAINAKMVEASEAATPLRVGKRNMAMLDLDVAALTARQNRLNELAYNIDNDMRSAWCADLSDELTGTVSTMEVIGQPTHILIAPQQRGTGENLPHGALTPILPMSPAQAAFNWAILPGWQKFRPTYRTGEIVTLDQSADTCTVVLDGAWSVAQQLHVNQGTGELADVPVEYMTCNAAAFEVGDKVVVEFTEQKWEQPVVVGFVTEPKPCGLARFAVRVGAIHPTFFYDTEKGFVFVNSDCTDYLNRCASKLILKDTTTPGQQIEYLITQDSTTAGRVRIVMDGVEAVDMESASPLDSSRQFPISGFVYSDDHVYFFSRQGTTQWRFAGANPVPNDQMIGMMYELQADRLMMPKWLWSDLGGGTSDMEAVTFDREIWDGGATELMVRYCTFVSAGGFVPAQWPPPPPESTFPYEVDTSGTDTLMFPEYPTTDSFSGPFMPAPVAIYYEAGDPVVVAPTKKRFTFGGTDYISISLGPAGYEEIDGGYYTGFMFAYVMAITHTLEEYCLGGYAADELTGPGYVSHRRFFKFADNAEALNASYGLFQSIPATSSRIQHQSGITDGTVEAATYAELQDGWAQTSADATYQERFTAGGEPFTKDFQYLASASIPSRSGPVSKSQSFPSASHVRPGYVFYSGDVPVLAEIVTYDKDFSPPLAKDSDYKSVFYAGQLHPAQSITKIACHDMRQEGQPKLVAFYADTGWKVFVEDDYGTQTDVTTDFFTKLNAFLGTEYTPADADVEMFFIRNLNQDEQSALARALFAGVNQVRVENGVAPLQHFALISPIAQAHAVVIKNDLDALPPEQQADYDMHQGDQDRFNEMWSLYPGTTLAAENAAYDSLGRVSVLIQGWKDSPGHFASMINPAYTGAGMGAYLAPDGSLTAVNLFIG